MLGHPSPGAIPYHPASPGPRQSLSNLASMRTFSVSSSLRDSIMKPPRENVRLVMALPGLCAPFQYLRHACRIYLCRRTTFVFDTSHYSDCYHTTLR